MHCKLHLYAYMRLVNKTERSWAYNGLFKTIIGAIACSKTITRALQACQSYKVRILRLFCWLGTNLPYTLHSWTVSSVAAVQSVSCQQQRRVSLAQIGLVHRSSRLVSLCCRNLKSLLLMVKSEKEKSILKKNTSLFLS